MGELQGANATPSRLHSKVEFDSDDARVKLASLVATTPDGPPWIVVSGPGPCCTTTLRVVCAGPPSNPVTRNPTVTVPGAGAGETCEGCGSAPVPVSIEPLPSRSHAKSAIGPSE